MPEPKNQRKPARAVLPQLMKWQDNCGCPICSQNANQVRAQGQAYPSGHKLPAVHDGCTCELTPVAQEEQ
jgi:hypothetical protein